MNELTQSQLKSRKVYADKWRWITNYSLLRSIIFIAWLFSFFLLWFDLLGLRSHYLLNLLFAAGVYLILYLELRKERNKAKAEKRRADDYGELVKERIGFQTGRLEIEIAITNFDGDCETTWFWSDIRKMHPESTVTVIPGRMGFSTPKAAFSEFPQLVPESADKYEIRFLSKEVNRCVFEVHVIEDLDEIGFGYTASVNCGFNMLEEDLLGEVFKYEWFGFYIVRIVETLCIKVSFPRHYLPEAIQPDVCVGSSPTETNNKDEVDRIHGEGGFKIEPNTISLIVKKPKLGYLYCLRWRPLPAIVVNGIRNRPTV